MQNFNRGFSFIVGVGAFLLLGRLFGIGWISDVRHFLSAWFAGEAIFQSAPGVMQMCSVGGDICCGGESGVCVARDGTPLSSPAALITEFFFEAVVSFGSAIVLTSQGLWHFVTIVWSFAGDAAGTGLKYVKQKQEVEEVEQVKQAVVTGDARIAKIETSQADILTLLAELHTYIKRVDNQVRLVAKTKQTGSDSKDAAG